MAFKELSLKQIKQTFFEELNPILRLCTSRNFRTMKKTHRVTAYYPVFLVQWKLLVKNYLKQDKELFPLCVIYIKF